MLTKSIPMVLNYRKVEHKHHTFNVMEACAIMCFNTGNLVFKDICPNRFRTCDKDDRWCLERACEGKDGYLHVRWGLTNFLENVVMWSLAVGTMSMLLVIRSHS